jgi:3-oxoacyl-[acyl-carrier-protein] synthase II
VWRRRFREERDVAALGGLGPAAAANMLAAGLGAAIAAELGATPVTAPKSFFGHIGAGGGAVELAASVLGLEAGLVPPTLNYETPDPLCPVNVVRGGPLAGRPGTALAVNCCSMGQVATVLVASP